MMESAQREAIVAAIEARMRSFEAAERDRDPERAMAHFATLRRTITDSTGKVARSQGAATWLWRNIDGRWLIVYVQLDHRPDGGEKA